MALLTYITGGLMGNALGGGAAAAARPEAMGAGAAPGEAAGAIGYTPTAEGATPMGGGWQDWVQQAQSLPQGGNQQSQQQDSTDKYLLEQQMLADMKRKLEEMKRQSGTAEQVGGFYG
jgi:hypothetical protein